MTGVGRVDVTSVVWGAAWAAECMCSDVLMTTDGWCGGMGGEVGTGGWLCDYAPVLKGKGTRRWLGARRSKTVRRKADAKAKEGMSLTENVRWGGPCASRTSAAAPVCIGVQEMQTGNTGCVKALELDL